MHYSNMEEGNVRAAMYLKNFFEHIASDPRVGTVHIAVYTAILNIWMRRGCTTPLLVFAWEVMPAAKVSTRMTYRKVIRELNAYGYLAYRASFSKYKGSRIVFGEIENVQEDGYRNFNKGGS
jgi:hypothetical protein